MKNDQDLDWRIVEDYPNYRVSRDGSVVQNIRTGRVLKQCDNDSGYPTVNLYNNGNRITVGVHRLVAELFVPGKEDGLEVNHKNGDKHRNHPDNLEWTNRSENELHAHRIGLKHGPNRAPIRVVESGEVFPSINECARAIGGDDTHIGDCLSGRYKTHLGLHFEYADVDPDEVAYTSGHRSIECSHKKPYRKPIRIVETGEIFPSVRDCAKAIGGDQPTITACLKGRHKTHHGYHYEFVDD